MRETNWLLVKSIGYFWATVRCCLSTPADGGTRSRFNVFSKGASGIVRQNLRPTRATKPSISSGLRAAAADATDSARRRARLAFAFRLAMVCGDVAYASPGKPTRRPPRARCTNASAAVVPASLPR